MAGSVAPVEIRRVDALTDVGGLHLWIIEFARFFTFPVSISSGGLLRSLPKYSLNRGGTWLHSASTASLHLITAPLATLLVVIQGKLYEEHFISNLIFFWPQVSCDVDCPIRGSRVVFASYRDSRNQIQKFAFRFSSACEAQMFINVVKERLMGVVNAEISNCKFGSEISSQSEYTVPSECVRMSPRSSFEVPERCYSPVMPDLEINSQELASTLQSYDFNDFETVVGTSLPPSFTALLGGCSLIHGQDGPVANSSSEFINVKKQVLAPEVADIESEIKKYMSNASFQDMLFKVEKVIDELGCELQP